MSNAKHRARTASAFVVVLLTACIESSGLGSNSEIRNNPDNFLFYASQLENESSTHEHMWTMTGSTGSISQMSVITSGEAHLTVFDNAGVEVYSRPLTAGGTFPTTTGAAGTWKVRVVLMRANGTVHFLLTNPVTNPPAVVARPAGVPY